MNRSLQCLAALALVALVALPARSDDEAKAAKKAAREAKKAAAAAAAAQDGAKPAQGQGAKGRGQANTPVAGLLKKAESAGLTEEELAKVKELAATYQPKYLELIGKLREAVGAEGMKKMNEARKTATGEGKKGKELQAAIAAVLTEEQQKARAEVTAAQQSLTTELRAKVTELVGAEKAKALGMAVPQPKKKKNAS